MGDVLVVGCGLIGASVGMALTQAGWDVLLHDENPSRVGHAVRRGAGRPWESNETVQTVLVAVPPQVTARVVIEVQLLDVGRTYTHVASVQSQPQREVEALSPDPSAVIGGHPLAGRELSGPGAATADLFVGRPWALCPGPSARQTALVDVRRLVAAVGADVVELAADAHDASVAVLSHLPQVASSALAAGLVRSVPVTESSGRLQLAGPGIVDTTRLAASDPDLWVQILELNAAEVAPVVTVLAERLAVTAAALTALAGTPTPADAAAAVAVLRDLLRDGNAGRVLVPVKRGFRSAAFAPVKVTVSDEPGRLAALLTDAGRAQVNVEDVHVEHVPGRPTGVIELLVAREDMGRLSDALVASGWTVDEQDDRR
ncbi:MAG: prephenate dehydrogenase [Frankiales bacterium]|jgi:prephenate dehydrogenase|nr:prephenate dehydrogenase [Frankiales bacterium]